MARKPRIHYPGAVYHVVLRGNDGQNVFFSQADRGRFYQLLDEGVKRFGHRIHAFCLMTNHIHLAIQVGPIPLSRIIQNLSFRYTRYINHRKKRIGHLFQGRYKAILINADSHLLELVRYIHLNPVRAGIEKDPLAYRWSGHKSYLGKQQLPWLDTDWVLAQFARRNNTARERYGSFVADGVSEGRRQEFHCGNIEGRILGDDRFAEQALQQAEEKYARRLAERDIVAAVCMVYGLMEKDLADKKRARRESEARAMATLLVLEHDELTLVNLGRILQRDISALSQAARRLRERMKNDVTAVRMLGEIRKQLDKHP